MEAPVSVGNELIDKNGFQCIRITKAREYFGQQNVRKHQQGQRNDGMPTKFTGIECDAKPDKYAKYSESSTR